MTQDPQNPNNYSGQTIIVNQAGKQSNGIGTAGFVLAVLAVVLCWFPILNLLLWLLGLIFSFVGVFKSPRGLSIAGLSISLLGIILILAALSNM